jgi:hypothetical protein
VTRKAFPQLITPRRIADDVGVSINRVLHVLATRPHIQPAALAGAIRLYRENAIAMVRHEIHAIDARRAARKEVAGA